MWRARAADCAVVLQDWYRPRTGLWSSAGWWNCANALTALIDYMTLSGDRSDEGVLPQTFVRAGGRGFVNEFFDDCGWWGLAWTRAFGLTGEERYLAAAQAIFAHMVTGWDEVFGGGVWWSVRRDYKNAITSELFGLLAARLHAGTGRQEYLDWATRTWSWFAASAMIGPSGLVNDGLDADGRNNGGTTWTYNQGVVLGLLTELHAATGSAAYQQAARRIADAALSALTDDGGVLTEPGDGDPDADRIQFKGIFVRHLRGLPAEAAYQEFVLANATSAWERARDPAGRIGYLWSGPFDRADAGRQAGALDLLNSAMAIDPVLSQFLQ
jgi:predicted alpha-1,6-mannanase (GH76 family)